MASLGHELRHALEVLSERGITSGASMFNYYKRPGLWVGGRRRGDLDPPLRRRQS